MARLVLAAVFFICLNGWRYDPINPQPLLANIAIAIFILAAVTDALDGYLARRWEVVSVFGRIMDPVCDKILVLGAFIYLAGPRFVMPERVEAGDLFAMSSGVYPWMVVLIVFRELMVTGVRSVAEAMGLSFGSNWWGKWKMILQTIAIPVAILVAANFLPSTDDTRWMVYIRDGLIWGTLVLTLVSGVPYLRDFFKGVQEHDRSDHEDGL